MVDSDCHLERESSVTGHGPRAATHAGEANVSYTVKSIRALLRIRHWVGPVSLVDVRLVVGFDDGNVFQAAYIAVDFNLGLQVGYAHVDVGRVSDAYAHVLILLNHGRTWLNGKQVARHR